MRKLIHRVLKKFNKLLFNKTLGDINNSQNEKLNGATIIGNEKNVSVGDLVSFGGNVVLYATAPITIGNQSMIGINTIFHTSTHDYNNHPMWLQRIDSPICIGKHVWIGASVIILAGVKIEDYAVIGAGTVVSANVPRGAIVAGNPARILKFRDLKNIENQRVDNEKYPGEVIVKDGKSTYIKSKM